MTGVQRKRRAAQFEWEIDDTDIYVPAEDLYEMDAQQEDSGARDRSTCWIKSWLE